MMSLYQINDFLCPWIYINSKPSKNLRDILTDGINIYIKADEKSKERIKLIIRDLHNASLLIDDIEDSSLLRRGFATAHIVFGIPVTINSANYLYFDILKKLEDNKDAQKVYIDEMINLHRGQGKELYWRDIGLADNDFKLPSEEDYISMVCDKTGGLFRMTAGLLWAFSSVKNDVIKKDKLNVLLNNIAKYYQIRDDLINLISEDYQNTKGYCEDITEGKLSFPILYGLKQNSELLEDIRLKTQDYNKKREIVNKLSSIGAFDYTKDYLNRLKEEIFQNLKEWPKSEPMEYLIKYLFN